VSVLARLGGVASSEIQEFLEIDQEHLACGHELDLAVVSRTSRHVGTRPSGRLT
jgi:hypothetical protein